MILPNVHICLEFIGKASCTVNLRKRSLESLRLHSLCRRTTFLLLPSCHSNTLPGPPTPHSSPTSPRWVTHFHAPAVHCSTSVAQRGKSSQLLPQIPRLHALPWGCFLIPTSPNVYLNNTNWHQWSASLSQICFPDIISNLVLELVSWPISYSRQVAFCSSHWYNLALASFPILHLRTPSFAN